VNAHEIAFFDLNRDENVGSRSHRENQMADSHLRRCPKRNNEADHNWVPHKAVKAGRSKTEIFILLVKIHLSQAEQIEVIDEKCRGQNDEHAETIQGVEGQLCVGVGYVPDDAAHAKRADRA